MFQAIVFVTIWSLLFWRLGRRIRTAKCGRELARTGYALFALALGGTVLMAFGAAIDAGPARPLTAGERLLIAGAALFLPVSGGSAMQAYLKRAAGCDG
ncbi:hypothetical protein Ocepr_0271 [Oceanithermus profundus DSM 14977]|uniref:Uncharacterized protein n=1 Tax=Oceanithermus profundus (strain DSM 14977 / NBRC 100410 / VKM B-2274 / 506) TaxID=670487 RepID=E4U5W9_OCEP5|nr:hypothetical protein [Oceanithermus profundus]ADR35733.1 hypothetical protein Ocepr_0271 [Oceanithermus profundus DSM 14977]